MLGADGRAEAVLPAEALNAAPPGATVAATAERIGAAGRVAEDADLFGAALKMARTGDPWLVVEDAEGRYVGMLTGPSLRRAFGQR